MRKKIFTTAVFGAAALLAGTLATMPVASADTLPDEKQCKKAAKTADNTIKGWCVAITRRKGNCLACHGVTTKARWPETLPPGGNMGPPLVAMKQRFPDKAKLRAQVYDATKANPHSVMPPFGKHKLLSEKEIDLIVEWLQTI